MIATTAPADKATDGEPEYDYGPDYYEGWSPEAEHWDFHYSTKSEWHAAWHRENRVPMGQAGCPEDACDGEPEPLWRGVWIDSPNLCDGPPPPEPPF